MIGVNRGPFIDLPNKPATFQRKLWAFLEATQIFDHMIGTFLVAPCPHLMGNMLNASISPRSLPNHWIRKLRILGDLPQQNAGSTPKKKTGNSEPKSKLPFPRAVVPRHILSIRQCSMNLWKDREICDHGLLAIPKDLKPENGPLQSGWVIVEKYASQVVKCKKSWKKCKDLRLIIPTLVS
jgi:hypothetical protein